MKVDHVKSVVIILTMDQRIHQVGSAPLSKAMISLASQLRTISMENIDSILSAVVVSAY